MYAQNRKDFDRYLTEREERQFFNTIKERMNKESVAGLLNMRDFYMFKIMRNTGLRVGTLVALNVLDATAAIQNKKFHLNKEILKGKKQDAKIYCNKKAIEALRELLKIRRLLGYPSNDEAPLLMSRKGARISIRTTQQRVQYWREASGIDAKASPHWFRHTLAKRVMKNSTASDPLKTVQILLNHSDPRSTAAYTLPDKEDIVLAAEEIAS